MYTPEPFTEQNLANVAVKLNSGHPYNSSANLLILISDSNLLKRIEKLHYFHTKYKNISLYYIGQVFYLNINIYNNEQAYADIKQTLKLTRKK